jgi:hypothetical protein
VPTQTTAELQRRTIADFGEQWQRYSDNSGFYGSIELFQDAFTRCRPDDIAGRRGPTSAAARDIVHAAVRGRYGHRDQPSEAYAVLEANTNSVRDRVLPRRGDEIPRENFRRSPRRPAPHPDPKPVVEAAWRRLWAAGSRSGYGRGQRGHLALSEPLRAITPAARRAPRPVVFSRSRCPPTRFSAAVPLRSALHGERVRGSAGRRAINIYDQLNPAYAKYYKRTGVEL